MLILSLALSEACNLNCSYCNVDKKSKKKISGEYAVEQYHNLRQLHPDDIIQIDFYGGEPLMQYDIVQYVIEQLKDEPNVKFFMPTNGLLLTEDKIDYLQRHAVDVSISFDGLWQDTNRLQPNNKGTLDRYLDKALLFRKLSNLHVHTMIQPGNNDLLNNHLFILEHMGANPMLTLVRDVGVWTPTAVEQLKAGITELFDWYTINASTHDMPNFIRFYLKSVVLYKAKQHEVSSCGAGKTHFSVSENKLTPCNRFKDNPERVALIPIYNHMAACNTCEIKPYCKKGCLHEQIVNGGPIVELCDIYKHIFKEVFSMIEKLRSNPSFINIVKEEIANELI